ncbi:MAG: ketoacyl-ACP synthase III [Azoarcus sp.]|nr:ketoacyl-ACP synthase III [Azoarcus sp.]
MSNDLLLSTPDVTCSAILPITILSSGKALPGRKVLSTELDERLSKPEGWTQKHSGVAYRYHARIDEHQSAIAAEAVHDALSRGGIAPESIDLLLSTSGVQEQPLPSTASLILDRLRLRTGTPGFDINASCLGFLVALHVAANLLNTSAYRRIAIVASDLASRGLDWNNPEASLIFGDGAAAVIVERGDGSRGIESYQLNTWTEGRKYCEVRGGGTHYNPRTGAQLSDYLFRMDGKRLFRLAASVMKGFLAELLGKARRSLSDIDIFVPHQASHLGMKHVTERLRMPTNRVMDIYATHGNQVAASIPTALHEALVTGRARSGRRVMLIGTAAGLAVGGMVLAL